MTIATEILENVLSKTKEHNQINDKVIDGLREELIIGSKPRVDQLVEAFSKQDVEVIE